MKPEPGTICGTCAAPVSGMNECPRCGRPIVRAEKPTSIVVRAITVAFVLVALAVSFTAVVGVVGWFSQLLASVPR